MIIYRAYIPGRLENGIEPCYIGKTVQSLADRENQHWRAAGESRHEERGKAGKLHRIMWAEGRDSGKVKFEEIASAASNQELAEKERCYVLKYNSKDQGWNSVVPSGQVLATSELSKISVMEQEIFFDGYKDLSRKLSDAFEVNASYSTLLLNLQDAIDPNNPKDLEDACKLTIATANRTVYQQRKRIIFGTAVSGKQWFKQIVENKALNKNKLSSNQLRRLLNGKDDEASIEAALMEKPQRVAQEYEISHEDKKFGPHASVISLLNDLKIAFPKTTFPRDTTVHTNLRKGYSLSQAVGLEAPPWATTPLWLLCSHLIGEGFEFIGEKRHEGEPVVSYHWKTVYASKKECAKKFRLDYTTLCEKLQQMELDEYLASKDKTSNE